MSRKDYYGFNKSRRGSTVFWIFFGIIVFAALYFPLFGGNLKYLIGSYVTGIFEKIGAILYVAGLFLMVIPVFFIRSKKFWKLFFLGLAFYVLSIMFFNPRFWGVVTNLTPVSKGYH